MEAQRKKEIQYEADSSQARVDDYFRKNPMTGDPFKDIGGLLATRDDRNRAIAARNSLNTAADRDVTMRGQDITKELGLGDIGVRKDANNVARMGHQLGFVAEMGKTAAYERGQNQQFELGKGELDINRAILDMQQDRYNNVTKVSDRLSLAEKAAGARVGATDAGFELSDALFKETSKYLKDGVAKPTQPMLEESDTMYNKVPEQFSEPVTGIPTASSESRGVSPIFQAANLGVMLGKQINRAATPPRSSLRRRVKKVQ